MKQKKKRKEVNDKNYKQFGKLGWCMNQKIECIGNCSECTLMHYPELNDKVEYDEEEEDYIYGKK